MMASQLATKAPWKACIEHGVAYSLCWACNKPSGLCSYGLCGETPTHAVAGRKCCEPHAHYLAQINGGTVKEIDSEKAGGDR